MFRSPRATQPQREAQIFANIIHPLPCYQWGPMAMHYLGVPIIVSDFFIVLEDEHVHAALHKLQVEGFQKVVPDRRPHPDILVHHPDPEAVIARITAQYITLDQATTTLKAPLSEAQVVIVPNSFAQLSLESSDWAVESQDKFITHGNLRCPLEENLVQSFAKCALVEAIPRKTTWGRTLMTWISLMLRYLDIESDVLDSCDHTDAADWYSINFGRQRHAQYGPPDYRISKRLGSAREMPVDSRLRPVKDDFRTAEQATH